MSTQPNNHADKPQSPAEQSANEADEPNRRGFLSLSSSIAMAGGLVASYGSLAFMAGRYLYPSQPQPLAWLFVTELDGMRPGDVIEFQTPIGQTVTISRRGAEGKSSDFLALSSVCPHLGCQVHWEPHNNRFFCPCHNGAFDPEGKPTEGPPADANQALPTYPIRVDNGMIFIQAPVQSLGS